MRAPAACVGSIAIALAAVVAAQPIPPASIAGQAIGWIKIYDFKDITAPTKVDHRVYSPAQLTIGARFANWMQASYVPTGALGDLTRAVSEKLGPNNQNTAALPQSYGVYGRIYTDLKYGPDKTIVRASNSHLTWNILANGFYGEPADALSTPEHYYFTLPTFVQQGYTEELEKAVDLSGHPFLGQFPSWFQRNSFNGNRKFVLLSRDRRLPFVTLTKGEYLDAVGVAITRYYEKEKKRITEAEQGDPKRVAQWVKPLEEKTARRRAVLAANREKYQARLQETAAIWTMAPDVLLENYPDVFEGNGGTRMRLPVYTIDAATVARAKGDAPLWIVVSWTAHLNDPVNKHLHEAVINNFNFEYVYNYFFDPAKVKGQPYRPLRSPAHTETTVAAEASSAGRKNATDPNVHFFDDFSTTPAGKAPLNWKSTLDNTGASSVVTKLDGLDGQWASMAGFRLTPSHLKTPLPRDFAVSYELVAARGFTWGARGMTLRVSKAAAAGGAESFVSLRLRPGFDGRDGEAVVDAQFPSTQGYLGGTKYATVPGFSNNAQNNRITVTVVKKGETLEVFIGQARIAVYDKAIPAAMLFDAVSFELPGGPNDRMFVSNIKVTTANP